MSFLDAGLYFKVADIPDGENFMADLKGCPFGQDIKNDCKSCDYGDTNHFDAATGKCVKR